MGNHEVHRTNAGSPAAGSPAANPLLADLAHRGGLAVEVGEIRPPSDVFHRLGGRRVVERVVDGLYDRIAVDPVLEPIFLGRARGRHLPQKYFFEEWMGGEPLYRKKIGGRGTRLLHERFPIHRRAAGRWLGHMISSLREQGVEPELVREIARRLGPMAHALGRRDGDPLPPGLDPKDAAALRRFLEADPERIRRHAGTLRRRLFEAASTGDLDGVRACVDSGVPVNPPSLSGELMVTPWCAARAAGHDRIARLLRDAGAVIDVFSAAYLGDLHLLRALVEELPARADAEDPAMDHRGITPLHHAVGNDRLEAALYLLRHGARPRADGFRLLARAADQGWEELVDALLDAGADAREVRPGKWVAHRSVAERLFAQGATVVDPPEAWLRLCGPTSTAGDDPDLVSALLDRGVHVDARLGGQGALHLAVDAGHIHILRRLLDHGLPVDTPDAHGDTPLAHVAWADPRADRSALTRLLLDHGADPRRPGAHGHSPLDRARRLRDPAGRERYRWMKEAAERLGG